MECWPALVKYPSSWSRCVHTRFFFFFVDKGDILSKTFEKIHNLRMQEQDSHKVCTILRNIIKEFLRTISGHWHPCPEVFSDVWPWVILWSFTCFICLRVSCIVYLESAHKTYSVTIYCHKIILAVKRKTLVMQVSYPYLGYIRDFCGQVFPFGTCCMWGYGRSTNLFIVR